MRQPSLALAPTSPVPAGRLARLGLERPLGRIGLAGVAAVLVLLSLLRWIVPPLGPWPVEPLDPAAELVGVGIAILWAAVTLLALAGRDTYRFGWLLVLSALADQIWLVGFNRIDALYFIAENFKGLSTVVFAHVLLGFPTGRLERRHERWLVRGLYAYVLAGGVIRSLIWAPDYGCEIYCPRNPFAVLPNEAAVGAFDAVTAGLVPILGIAVVAAVWRHWLGASPAGRRALLPVALAAPVAYVVSSAFYLAQQWGDAAILAIVASPIVQATSVVMPLAMLAGLLLTRLARGNVAALAVELANGVPVGGLQPVLARALRDPTVVVAFPAPEGEGLIDSTGRPIAVSVAPGDRSTTRLERDGELLAVLVHDVAVEREDPGLLQAVASVARLALENERLSAQVLAQLDEVRASRQRIVEAADEERRRVERDLHDGAQQRLVALAMRLQLGRDSVPGIAELIDDATAELRAAIADVRSLARGVHPTILSDAGLAAAVEALAERTPVPVHVDIPDVRMPAAVEAAAYYVVAEALTNVVRYAGATEVRVTAVVDQDRLVLTVTDDGAGGADADRGSGLRGLADRVAAARGRLSVSSPLGSGTAVRAELPLA